MLAILPIDSVWVDANFKENQLAGLRIGQSATVTADMYGSKVRYNGKVLGLTAGTGSALAVLPAQNASGNWIKIVQRLPVRIGLDPQELDETSAVPRALHHGRRWTCTIRAARRCRCSPPGRPRSTPTCMPTRMRAWTRRSARSSPRTSVRCQRRRQRRSRSEDGRDHGGARLAGGAIQWVIAPVVALAAFMEIMDISIANVALPHIAGALSSSQNESTWVLTSYLVTNAIVMPISGWLANTFGRKRLFLTCIAGFTVSLAAVRARTQPADPHLLRALQGATGGGLQPVGQAILADSFPPEKRGMASAIYGVAAVVAPTVGPTLGGWITDSYDWRWIFLINVPVGIVLILLVQSLIKDKTQPVKGGGSRVDWLGFGFVALSLGCLQVVLDRGQDADWFGSALITTLTITSAVAFVLLIWRELHHRNPMVDLRLIKNPDFAVTFVLMLMLGFMLFGSTFLIPAYTQELMGYRAVDAGMVLTPGGFATIAAAATDRAARSTRSTCASSPPSDS